MNPESADAIQEAFLEFEKGDGAAVDLFWCEGGAFWAGFNLKHTAALEGDNPLGELDFPENGDTARGAIGPSRLELDKPVIAPPLILHSQTSCLNLPNSYCTI